MKCTKKILCFLLVALMIVPAFSGLIASAAAEYSFKEDSSKAYEVADGVFYSEYTALVHMLKKAKKHLLVMHIEFLLKKVSYMTTVTL